MITLLPIQSLTVGSIRDVLRRALHDEGGVLATVVDFVASVDWSPAEGEIDLGVRDLLADRRGRLDVQSVIAAIVSLPQSPADGWRRWATIRRDARIVRGEESN